MTDDVLAVEGLTTCFFTRRGIVQAVNDVDLRLGRGESLGIVGETGSGKSALAWSIVDLVPPPGRIIRGGVFLDGRPLIGQAPDEMRRIRGKDISLIVQNARAHLNPLVRVGDQIANAYRPHAAGSAQDVKARVLQMLEAVAMPDPVRRARAYPHELSGGMAQRVMIAMAMIHSPKVLIADEPTMGLDVTIQAQILDLLQAQVEQQRASTIVVTRDLGIVANYCGRVGVMHAGAIVELAPVASFVEGQGPRHPYSIALVGATSFGPRRARSRFLGGSPPNPLELPNGCHYQRRCGFASAQCFEVAPKLEEVAPGHLVRCHYWKDVVKWRS
jgi:oligopeptide/dipeptide ABC transporter ATP-binding protein